jgi:hypothetical protein
LKQGSSKLPNCIVRLLRPHPFIDRRHRFANVRSWRTRCALGWALLAFVSLQCVAVLHGLAHGDGDDEGPATPVVATAAATASTPGWVRGLLDVVATDDKGSLTCKSLDQLAHAPLLWMPPVFEGDVDSAPRPADRPLGDWRPAPESHYSARAPPARVG